MKKLIAFVVIIGCIAAIIIGYMDWSKKIADVTQQSSDSEKVPENVTTEVPDAAVSDIRALPQHFPAILADKLQKQGHLSLVAMGDEATSSGPEGWPAQLQAKLTEEYGEGVWTVTVKEWQGENTAELLAHNRMAELTAVEPDVVLFQVPLRTDNLEIGSGHSVPNVEKLLEQLKTEVPSAVVILQPPNPVYNTENYPKAEAALQQFAAQHEYSYIDHWPAWSSTGGLIGEAQGRYGFPTSKGHSVWAQVVSQYFVEEQ